MKSRGLLAAAFGVVSLAQAGLINPGYTVIGSGGLSGPGSGFSNEPFWWVDTTGGVAGSAYAAYGFEPVPNYSTFGTGSLLLSNPFTVQEGETLDISLTVMTAHSDPFTDVEFAVLLEGSIVRAVMCVTRPDGLNHLWDFGPIPGTVFVESSPGVTKSAQGGNFASPITIGGILYGQVNGPADCYSGPCMTDVSSSITPGSGTYQLLFGAYIGNFDAERPAALAVKSVSVSAPEPSAGPELLLMLLLIGAVGFRLRSGRAGGQALKL